MNDFLDDELKQMEERESSGEELITDVCHFRRTLP